MRVIYASKGKSKKFWDARYTLGARYLSKNTVIRVIQNYFWVRLKTLLTCVVLHRTCRILISCNTDKGKCASGV